MGGGLCLEKIQEIHIRGSLLGERAERGIGDKYINSSHEFYHDDGGEVDCWIK